MCDVAPLDVVDVLLGQPYLWRQHVLYEYRSRAVIITLGNNLYWIPEVVLSPDISLTTAKQRSKIVSQTKKFIFITIRPEGNKKIVAIAPKHVSPARQQ